MHPSISNPTVVATFDKDKAETPESLDFDRHGNMYVSLALTGEIRKITPKGEQSTLATFSLGDFPAQPCHGFIGILGAIVIHRHWAFINVNACDLESRGIWRVDLADGAKQKVASVPAHALLNGLTIRGRHLYAADSAVGRLWRAPIDGNGEEAQVWVMSPLLDLVPNPFGAPGANGIQQYRNEFLVANSSAATIIGIPVQGDSPGTPYVKFNTNVGVDDFAVDVIGRLYCTTDPFQTILRVGPAGVETLFEAAAGLDGPTSARFGVWEEVRTVYVTNASFPFFPSTGNGPSVVKFDVDLPGYPR